MNEKNKRFKFNSTYKKVLADTYTPVSIYLKLRDQYPKSILLESSDHHGDENAFSYVCCNPIAEIKVEDRQVTTIFPDGTANKTRINNKEQVPAAISNFSNSFIPEDMGLNFITHGLFGYMAYDAVKYFEDIDIDDSYRDHKIPDILYRIYRNVIAIDHVKNELHLISHEIENERSNIEDVYSIIRSPIVNTFDFQTYGIEESNLTDEQYLEIVEIAKQHCNQGDVFQLVLSRRFSQQFKGDEFNVYRCLRSINPSPYLFYFDIGPFKIFGSSPEAQIIVQDNKAEIHPIAGTFLRTGNDVQDAKLAEQLSQDPKENAEHTMLVDLARNDLSRNGKNVTVETYKDIHYYSHVIHLVSRVSAQIEDDANTIKIVGDTFPAGTLSGAPKYKALSLIKKYENGNRHFYGGCIGLMDFKGNFNSAIMIRSFLSKENKLIYQAGAGVVVDSVPEKEKDEVYNKLTALKKAIELANQL